MSSGSASSARWRSAGLVASHAERVLEERAARGVVLEELAEAALLGADGLVDGLGLLVGGLAHEHLAGLLGATQVLVRGLAEGWVEIDLPLAPTNDDTAYRVRFIDPDRWADELTGAFGVMSEVRRQTSDDLADSASVDHVE